MPVEERLVSVEELLSAARDGRLEEAFGCGTAAVVSPIGELVFGQEQAVIHQRQIGPLTQRLYDALTGIQYGTAPDPHGWAMRGDLKTCLRCGPAHCRPPFFCICFALFRIGIIREGPGLQNAGVCGII